MNLSYPALPRVPVEISGLCFLPVPILVYSVYSVELV